MPSTTEYPGCTDCCETGCCTDVSIPATLYVTLNGTCTFPLFQTDFTANAGIWSGAAPVPDAGCTNCPIVLDLRQECGTSDFEINYLDSVSFPEQTRATPDSCDPFMISLTGSPIFDDHGFCFGDVTTLVITE